MVQAHLTLVCCRDSGRHSRRSTKQELYHLFAFPENPLESEQRQEEREHRPGVPERDRGIGIERNRRRLGQVAEQCVRDQRRVKLTPG